MAVATGISTGHGLIAKESGVLQGQCFHSYDDKCEAKEGMRAEVWWGGGNSNVDSGRRSLRGEIVRVTLLGGSVES